MAANILPCLQDKPLTKIFENWSVYRLTMCCIAQTFGQITAISAKLKANWGQKHSNKTGW